MSISIAVFAHNEEDNIERCIRSIYLSSQAPENILVKVLINGTTDNTRHIIELLQKEYLTLSYIDITLGDKSNAWNTFVYDIDNFNQKFYFLDGDNWLPSYSLDFIDKEFDTAKYSAIAPTPIGVTERLRGELIDRKFISGNFYGVSGDFLKDVIIGNNFKLPIGFIGDDSLVMYLLEEGIQGKEELKGIKVLSSVGPVIPRVKINLGMITFAHNRYKRYALRHFQQEVFYFLARNNRLEDLPEKASDIKNLLFKIGHKPFLSLCGIQTFYHPYAIFKILTAKG
ncbi:MAG: glycosyltransferase involved in cell wall biosynthesis [Dokdonia sp.]|jgi:glycosyltransferase involved in cell wall biosynthesis